MRSLSALLVACVAVVLVAADFKDVDPNVFPKDDPRAKDLPRMMWNDAKKRMQEANLRETKAFAEVIKSFRKQPTAVPLLSPRGSAEASLDEAA